MKTPLTKLVRAPLHEAWRHEATEFTPWLAEEANLNALADALGLGDLELVATEHWVGDFKVARPFLPHRGVAPKQPHRG